jgi:3-oxoadipate enol-lactonase
MPQEQINGFSMHYESYGTGFPLVMVHGGLGGGDGSAGMVKHHAAPMREVYRAIFYDRRAAGRSESPPGGYDIPNQVEDLRALLIRLGVERAHVLGSSAGGPIVMRLALDYPQMVDRLALINTMSYASEPERQARQKELDTLEANAEAQGKEAAVGEALENRNPGGRDNHPDEFNRLQTANLQRFEGIINSLRAYLDIGGSIETRLDSLSHPTLIVHGDADERIPVECSRRLNELIPNSELHVIPGAGHGLMTNVPELMRELVLEFLSRSALDPMPSGTGTA